MSRIEILSFTFKYLKSLSLVNAMHPISCLFSALPTINDFQVGWGMVAYKGAPHAIAVSLVVVFNFFRPNGHEHFISSRAKRSRG